MLPAARLSFYPAASLSPGRGRNRPRRSGLLRGICLLALIGGILLAAGHAVIQRQIQSTTRGHLYATVQDAPARPVALVFGAGIRRGRPSPILYDRLFTAAELYRAGKVQKLLVTGDNGSLDYNEVAVMRRALMRMGVPGEDVVKDHAGFRTYDSCYRARDVFDVDRAILVTQAFHLPRAVYLARTMGIDAVGVRADRRPYTRESGYRWREWLACSWSWVELNITRPRPRFLGPKEPLFSRIASTDPPAPAPP
ncbi:MAG: YdcF family protein [Armatimonadetes bacterium]|nr:YdcF family protein [Armatimonadota bacterium]